MEASSSQNGDTTAAEPAGPRLDPFPSASILTTEDDMDTEDMQQRLNRVLQVDLSITLFIIAYCQLI